MLDYIIVLVLSMLPVAELRFAIPYGYNICHLPIIPVTAIAIIGNLLPVPFLIVFGGKVLHYFAKFEKLGIPFRKIIEIGEKKVAKMGYKARAALFWALFAFVAVPLPGTGAWTGALVAITLGLKLKRSFWPIALGVLGAGAIIVSLFYFAPEVLKMFIEI